MQRRKHDCTWILPSLQPLLQISDSPDPTRDVLVMAQLKNGKQQQETLSRHVMGTKTSASHFLSHPLLV